MLPFTKFKGNIMKKLICLVFILMVGSANAGRVKVLFAPVNWSNSSWASDSCSILYFETSDLKQIEAGVGDEFYSEYYFSCDTEPLEIIQFDKSQTRFQINGAKFKCPVDVFSIGHDGFDVIFDCSKTGIFKNGFEEFDPWH